MEPRKWHMGEALKSMAGLIKFLPMLSLEEVLACLELESQAARRKSVIDRLIARAVRLNEIAYNRALDKKYRNH